MSDQPTPVGELYVLRLLQASSCFRAAEVLLNRGWGRRDTVCAMPPCACAQSLLDEIGKPLHAENERLRARVTHLEEQLLQALGERVPRRALEGK